MIRVLFICHGKR